MIICRVCNSENDEFATVCAKCKSYIQNRIPNIDFFEMIWKVIESPHKAFHDITLAEHKNYAILLFSFFGVALSFATFWFFQLGVRFDSLLDILSRATLVGIGLGYIATIIFTAVFHSLARIFGARRGVRDSLAILGYSTTPILLSLLTILPVELLTFGMYLFTANPHPYTIKPELYIVLLSADGLFGLWAISLAVIGTRVGLQLSYLRAICVVLMTVGISMGIIFILTRYLVLII